jgi:uncharacterized membrane protein
MCVTRHCLEWRCVKLKNELKKILIAGFAVIVPIGLTLYIFFFLIDIFDSLLRIIPQKYQPEALFGVSIPGFGVIVIFILIFLFGLIAKSYFGYTIVSSTENIVHKIPFIGRIYQSIKQVSDSMFADRSSSFKKVVLVEFPRKGMYTVAFVTGMPGTQIQENLPRKCTSVFVPTTPNPTSGYLIIVPEEELIPVDISVEEALTYIISIGMVSASDHMKKKYLLPGHKESNNKNERNSVC